jgi:hypothetical protein
VGLHAGNDEFLRRKQIELHMVNFSHGPRAKLRIVFLAPGRSIHGVYVLYYLATNFSFVRILDFFLN